MINHTSLKIVVVAGGVISLGGAAYFSSKIHSNIQDTEPYKKSVKLLRDYPVAVQYLGQPIRSKRVDLGDTDQNFIWNNKAQFAIPVLGPKGKGTLYSWASRQKAGDSWNIDQLDLELKNHGQRWTFYKNQLETTLNADTASQSQSESEK